MDNEAMIEKYETLSTDLLEWIQKTIVELNARQFHNSLSGVQKQLTDFNQYRTGVKPPKFTEKGELEVFFILNYFSTIKYKKCRRTHNKN